MELRIIKHEVKLEKSVKIILAVLAIGVMANAFPRASSVNDALAVHENSESQLGSRFHPLIIQCQKGCQ